MTLLPYDPRISLSRYPKLLRRALYWRAARAAAFAVVMLACAAAQADDAPCRYVKLATLPVVFSGYRPSVIGSVDEQSAVMLVDTGSWSTVLTMPGATRHDLNVIARNGSGTVLGVNGESELKYARVESVSIGGIKGARQDMPVIGQMQGGDAIDLLVGANFLFQADVEFNLSKPEISFFQPVGCGKAFLAYWGGNVYFVDTQRTNKLDRRPVFTVQVNGHDVDAIIDSGAAASLIDADVAASVGVSIGSSGVVKAGMSMGVGGHPVPQYLGTFDTVTIGAETLHKAKLFISDMNGGYRGSSDQALFGPKLLLGADFLKAHRVLFAGSQNRIYISYIGGEVFVGEQWKPRPAPAPAIPSQEMADPPPLAEPRQQQ